MKNKILLVLALCLGFFCLICLKKNSSLKDINRLNESIKDYDFVGPFGEGLAMVGKDGKAGFVNKRGELVIPMKLDFDGGYPIYYPSSVFINGIYTKDNLGVINTKGDLIVPQEKDLSYRHFDDGLSVVDFERDDVSFFKVIKDGEVVSEGKGTLVFSSNTLLTDDNGKYISTEDLKSMGYSNFEMYPESVYFPLMDVSGDPSDRVGYILFKDGKYGVVDNHGKTIFPFIHDNNKIFYWNGFFFVAVGKNVIGELGCNEFYSYWIDVYKNGEKIIGKVNLLLEKGHNFIYVHGIRGYGDKDVAETYKENIGIDMPMDLTKSFMLDSEGKIINRAPYGKNYLRFVENVDADYLWCLEDESGTPVLDMKFTIKYICDDYYCIWFNDKYMLLNEKGDTIDISYPKVFDEKFLKNGLLSFEDEKKNWFEPLYGYYDYFFKNMSNEDHILNISFYKRFMKKGKRTIYESTPDSKSMKRKELNFEKDVYGLYNRDHEQVLPYKFDEIEYFSEGLIHVKYNGRWYYTNENGDGLPAEAMME